MIRPSRLAVLGASAVAATAIGVVAAPAAFADTMDTGGTTTITVPTSTAAKVYAAGVVAYPADGASATYDSGAQTIAYSLKVSGGDGDVGNFTGTVRHSGSVVVSDYKTKRSTKISNITLDYINNTVDGTLSGSTKVVALFDLNGAGTTTNTGTSQSFTASELDVDAAGAAALNKALKAKVFTAGENVGSFATNYTVTNS